MARPHLKPASPERAAQVIKAVEGIDLNLFQEAKRELEHLSDRTIVDRIKVDPAGILVDGDRFEGLSVVSVALGYEKRGRKFSQSYAFWGRFSGHFAGDAARVDNFAVDTSPFYSEALG